MIVDFITSVSILNLRLQNCNFNRKPHVFHITDPFLRITDEILVLAIVENFTSAYSLGASPFSFPERELSRASRSRCQTKADWYPGYFAVLTLFSLQVINN